MSVKAPLSITPTPCKDCRWCLYMLTNPTQRRTYVGITVDFNRRLRQHNGELKGGARATRGQGPWRPVFRVEGLPRTFAHQLEWAVHRLGRRRRPKGLNAVAKRFYHVFGVVLSRDKVTRKAVPTKDVPYTVWYAEGYRPLTIGPQQVVFATTQARPPPPPRPQKEGKDIPKHLIKNERLTNR